MKNDKLITNNTQQEVNSKISHFIPLGFQKPRESLFIQKGREFFQSKKSCF